MMAEISGTAHLAIWRQQRPGELSPYGRTRTPEPAGRRTKRRGDRLTRSTEMKIDVDSS